MGPQRKQQMLDDACAASPQVEESYRELQLRLRQRHELATAIADLAPDERAAKTSLNMRLARVSNTVKEAQGGLHSALADYGMNRFNARELSNFAGKVDAISR